MGNKPAYKNPRVHVIMFDGAEWDIQVLNPDVLKYERTAARHKWPESGYSMNTITFMAWAASLREGLITSVVTWELFSETLCAEVRDVSREDEAAPTVPTEPGPVTG